MKLFSIIVMFEFIDAMHPPKLYDVEPVNLDLYENTVEFSQ